MLKPGDLVDGKYRVLLKIGQGGYSNVYLVMNEKVNKQWAIKEVRKTSDEHGEAVRRNLIAETEILKNLHHPHLPSIVDVIDRDDNYLIVMDYVEGRTLRTILRENRGPLPQNLVVNWALQMCDVFKYLHSQNPPIIYRDTKPSNIMLKPDGNIVLIDFGTAREYKEYKTEDTTCLGTHEYAAPEQFGHVRQTDGRTDIYNLGATMYHLLTYHTPSSMHNDMTQLKKWNPEISSGLVAIVSKCMAPEPEDRYQTEDELIYDLKHYQRLDVDEQKKDKRHFTAFTACLVLAAASWAGAFGFSRAETTYQRNTYAYLIRSAEAQTNDAEKEKIYDRAIQADPSKADAYESLLSVYLNDGSLTSKESASLVQELGFQGDTLSSVNLDSLKAADPEGYEELCYNIGLAYFYYYDGTGNKSMSKQWFGIAKDGDYLTKQKQERAERFYGIADYYTSLGQIDKAGDSSVSYADYWKDLSSLCSGNIAESDNVQTALVMYKELTYQISAHALEFQKAGVTEASLSSELDNVSKRLETDILQNPKYSEDQNGEDVKEIRSNLQSAEDAVRIVYAEGGDE